MYKVRDFEEKDLEFVKEQNYMLSMQIANCSDFDSANICTATDESGRIVGVAALSYHSSWFNPSDEAEHNLVLSYCFDDFCGAAWKPLINGIKKKYEALKDQKSNCDIVCWVNMDDTDEIQQIANEHFFLARAIIVMDFDLSKDIPQYDMPSGVQLEQLTLDEKGVEQYLDASALANNGAAYSRGALMFRALDEGFRVYVAKDGDEIVSAINLCGVEKDKGMLENVITIPKYSSQNLDRLMIAKGLEMFKEEGKSTVTISVAGDNYDARDLYAALGFEMSHKLVELHCRMV